MTERSLEKRYRLLAAAFRDSERSQPLRAHLESAFDSALELVSHVLAADVGLPPAELDREQIGTILGTLLPGRITGSEPYRHDLPDVLDAFLQFMAEDLSLPRAWEWATAVEAGRDSFHRALANPKRPASQTKVEHKPDRRPAPKIGRNDPCFCGSGKKYKQCCLKLLP